MITEIQGDIFEELESGRINILVHQCNCVHTMGAGIARIIAQKYPAAQIADNKTEKGPQKMGTYSVAKVSEGKFIVNLYGQETPASKERATSYDSLCAGFEKLRDLIQARTPNLVIGIPYGLGSDLAGGKFRIVRAIISAVFEDSPIKVVIVKLPTAKNLD